jgi:aryl-alcohol dehydrogenase-like predicted oxidoreductase
MQQVLLGATGLRVSAVGLGCSRFGSALNGASERDATALIQHAIDRGITLFDTADIYGQGQSERILGRAIRTHRNRLTVVSKGGRRFSTKQRIAALVKQPVRYLARRVPLVHSMVAASRSQRLTRDFTPTYLQLALERSLRRLQTDWIDLYMLHSPDRTDIQSSTTFGMLARAKERGLIAHWGISCDDLASAQAALQVRGAAVIEFPFSLLAPLQAHLAGTPILVGQLVASQTTPSLAETRHRIATVLEQPSASALIGTTKPAHLDEVLFA